MKTFIKPLMMMAALTIYGCDEKWTESDKVASISGEVDNHSYVDLGLPSGTLWATCNLGADNAAGLGNYYAWGETVASTDAKRNDNKWFENKDDNLPYIKKYNMVDSIGVVDSLTVLQIDDDAAAANWGGSWRMPTTEQFFELNDGCDWVLVKNYNKTGVSGRLGTSKSNGNVIFLPATGQSLQSKDSSLGEDGCYWSSDLDNSYNAYCVFLVCQWQQNSLYVNSNYRAEAVSVRAVLSSSPKD